jgi:hypothetical protein
VKHVWKLKKILFNVECYREFFSGITPSTLVQCCELAIVLRMGSEPFS